MPTAPMRVLVSLLIGVLLLTTSNALTLCVHEERVGVEPSWATCCESASCCTPAAARHADEAHEHVGSGHDGCRDLTLSLADAWAPDRASPGVDQGLSALLGPSLGPVARTRVALWLTPRVPRGVPPPVRLQRAPVLRI